MQSITVQFVSVSNTNPDLQDFILFSWIDGNPVNSMGMRVPQDCDSNTKELAADTIGNSALLLFEYRFMAQC